MIDRPEDPHAAPRRRLRMGRVVGRTDAAGVDEAAARAFASPPGDSGGRVDLVLFTGEWCPDCRRVSPAVLAAVEAPAVSGARVVVCDVSRDVWKGSRSEAIRAGWNVQCLPCVVRFDTRKATDSVLEDAQPGEVAAILAELIGSGTGGDGDGDEG